MYVVKNKLFILFVCGLLLRLFLLPLDYSWDVLSFISWGKEASRFGLAGFYQRPLQEWYAAQYPSYPPLPVYLFTLLYKLYQAINAVVWNLNITISAFPSNLVPLFKSIPFLAGLMKLPTVLADIALSGVVYHFVKKMHKHTAKALSVPLIAVALVLFNPAFFYTSALWGQIDNIPMVFILVAFYLLMFTSRLKLAWVSFVLALLAKQTAIVTFPVFAVVYIKKYGLARFIKNSLPALMIFWLSFLPFHQHGNILIFPFQTYTTSILGVSGIPFVSNHAFNFWALVTQWTDIPDSTPFLFNLPYSVWGHILTVVFVGLVIIALYRTKITAENVLLALCLVAFAVFSFMTKMHERHFQPALVFLIPLAAINSRYRKIFIVLSVFHFFNLYHNWAVVEIPLFIGVIRSSLFVNSMIVLGLGTFFILLKGYLARPDRIHPDSMGDTE